MNVYLESFRSVNCSVSQVRKMPTGGQKYTMGVGENILSWSTVDIEPERKHSSLTEGVHANMPSCSGHTVT